MFRVPMADSLAEKCHPALSLVLPMDLILAPLHLLAYLLGEVVVAFYGGLAGLLYPPHTPVWARVQKIGFALLCGALVAWVAAYTVACFSLGAMAFWILVIGGAVSFVGYLVVANVCRVYHEKHQKDEQEKKRENAKVDHGSH